MATSLKVAKVKFEVGLDVFLALVRTYLIPNPTDTTKMRVAATDIQRFLHGKRRVVESEENVGG